MAISYRLIVAIMGSITCGLVFSFQVNLSVAILAMVNQTAIEKDKQHDSADLCYHTSNFTSMITDYPAGAYEWSESLQGVILGSYFYGYTITQIIGGRFAEQWGAKWICIFAIVIPAILNALSPLAAKLHEIAFIIIRIIMGAFHGLVYSSLFSLYAKWYPLEERTTAIAALQFGGNIGAAIFTLLAGYLCKYGFFDGWPSVYYVGSAVHIIWLPLWLYFVYDTPAANPRISADEHIYILQNIDCPFSKKSKRGAPWKAILSSRAVYGSLIGKTSATFGYYVLMTKFPSYLESIFNVQILANSIYTAFIYLAIGLTLMIAGPLSTFVKRKSTLSLTRVRKLFQEFALFGPAICLVVVSLIGCNKIAVITLIVINMCTSGFTTGGEFPIIPEFAPEFAGTVFGFTNTFASAAGVLAPVIVGLILELDYNSVDKWNLVFYITAAVYVIGIIGFELFATALRQPWDQNEQYLSHIELEIINSNKVQCKKNEKKLSKNKKHKRRKIDTTTPDWVSYKKSVYVY